MPSVLVPLAAGAEELEAVTVVDLLRRAKFDVTLAGLEPGAVTCSRGTVIQPDTTIDQVLERSFDMIALPGGLPGANHLRDDTRLQLLLKEQAERDGWLAAVCAGPKALAQAGLLDGRTVTSFTGALDEADVPSTGAPVEVDGRIITGRGPGAAMDFALTLIEQLAGREARDAVEGPLLRP